jgi:hypothetical protein
VLFAVNVGAVATPLALVATAAVVPPPVNVPLAPVDGAANVTFTPEMTLPLLSFTVTCMGAKAVFTATLCDAPPVATITDGGPGWFVSVKLAAVAEPDVAFTV